MTRLNVASCLSQLGRTSEAIKITGEVYDLQVELFGESDGQTLFTQNNLLSLQAREGSAQEAGHRFRALAAARDGLGKNHPDIAFARHNAGFWFLKAGMAVEAERELAVAVAIRSALYDSGGAELESSRRLLAKARAAVEEGGDEV